MQGRSRSCNRIFVALEDCQRKHPRQAEVCEQLNKAAAWCAVRELCPSEGEDLYRGRAKVCLAFHGVQGMCAEGPKRSFNEFMTLLDMRACVCRRARAPARARSFMCACVRVAEVAALPPPRCAVDGLEACCGTGAGLVPPVVPETCSFQLQCLDECLDVHAESVESGDGKSSS